MSSVPVEQTPASGLLGREIDDGWVITEKLLRAGEAGAEDLTGSCFSLGYIAVKGKKKAFVKVIDIQGVLDDRSSGLGIVARLKRMTDRHTFESTILDVCRKAKLDRIVQVIGAGELEAPGSLLSIPIPYIMFEVADGGDVRKAIGASNKIDDAWRFRILHDVAVGLQQLHRHDIAHQDLKPSNVLVFKEAASRAKIGDLGRSSRRGTQAEHDAYDIPGAPRYAPPEQIFGVIPERWEDRREGGDVYHLGGLAAFLFSGMTLSVHLAEALRPEMRPHYWGGKGGCDYETALPILKVALAKFVQSIQKDFPAWASEELGQIILTACDPDYRTRGDPAARRRAGQPVGIDAYVSRFDRMAKQASVKSRA